MTRFFAFVVTGTLVSLVMILSACTSSGNLDYTSSIDGGYYHEARPLNPACADGFRPSDGRSCSY
ncbi:hypothetical protein [Rhizobium lentis]|uniref:hypothetical protein n=1 Tax=Rhizobium lentis TaxID=1138194 RepID=UPI001C83C6CD|nr:hypothetical protein [Rhizobium lentis]MBX5046256.1 hypothetical protein [Rhizobium lentis]MBX5058268.1 hypothetical protein [Rhizobium lentis]